MPTTNARPPATNLYAGACRTCGAQVDAGAGYRIRTASGWAVEHVSHLVCLAAVAAALNVAFVPDRPATPVPSVPAGHYAVTSATGNNDLDFYAVQRPTEGRWAGYVFVKRVIGGHPDTAVRGREATAALARILAEGIDTAAVRYGVELGRCYRCNRTLTDQLSRQLGIGPDCRGRDGAHASTRTVGALKARTVVHPGECHACGGGHARNAICPAVDPAAYAAAIAARVLVGVA